jgi:hypothetical protein
MRRRRRPAAYAPTTGYRRWLVVMLAIAAAGTACGRTEPPQAKNEPEMIARTEFTDRIENFFEYEALTPGKPSRFLIHLTDLSDGSPVEKADVTLAVRPADGRPAVETKARVGKVTGIYVAEVTVPAAGPYDIEFRVRSARINERMLLPDFKAP